MQGHGMANREAWQERGDVKQDTVSTEASLSSAATPISSK